MRDFLTIMAYGAKTIIKTGNEEDPSDVLDRRADFPYIRIPRKALLSTNDPELQLLGKIKTRIVLKMFSFRGLKDIIFLILNVVFEADIHKFSLKN